MNDPDGPGNPPVPGQPGWPDTGSTPCIPATGLMHPPGMPAGQEPHLPTGDQGQVGNGQGTDGVLYRRRATGEVLFLTPDNTWQTRAPALSAAHDNSTYYEYIKRHTGEQATVPGITPVPPAPQRKSKTLLIAAIAAFAVLAGSIFAGYALFAHPEDEVQETQLDANASPSTPAGQASTGDSREDTRPSTASGPEQSAAESQLQSLRTNDLDTVRSYAGMWVPQLKSMAAEPNDRMQHSSPDEVLAEYRKYEREYPGVRLIWSVDIDSYRFDNFWVIILDEYYSEAQGALDVCNSYGLSSTNCLAKKITTSGSWKQEYEVPGS